MLCLSIFVERTGKMGLKSGKIEAKWAFFGAKIR
jgi:hypothetical protein